MNRSTRRRAERSAKRSAAKEPALQRPQAAAIRPAGEAARHLDILLSLVIFLFALGVRLVYLFQIEAIPLFYHLAADGRSYDEWAQRIASGDWWGREVFYQAPLYPYFLGVLQSFFGRDLWWIRVVQALLGSAACVFLFWAGKTFFSRAAGIAAGLFLALYAPAVFFDGLIQKTVLDIFLISLLLLFLSRAQSNPGSLRWIAIGAVLGLLGLSRENALVWVLVAAAWIGIYFREHTTRMRFQWTALLLAGLMLVLAPVGWRNWRVGGELTLTTSQLGPNFFIGNNPAADGSYKPLRPGHGDPKFERGDAAQLAEQALGRSLSPGEVSGYWLGRAGEYIRTEPVQWLGLLAKKWLMVWNVHELEDADDFYLYQRWSPLLRGLATFSHFGFLAALAAVGCFLTWSRLRNIWVLYALIVTMAASVAVFYVFARYRLPLVPPLILLAGAGFVEIIALYRARAGYRIAAALGVFVLTAVIVHWPISGTPGPSSAGYNNLGNAFNKEGKLDAARESYQQALAVQPNYGVAHYNLAGLFAKQGDLKAAEHHLHEAIRINSDHAEAHNALANLRARQGELEAAAQHYRQALDLGLVHAETHFNLAVVLVKLGRLDAATESLKESVKVDPGYAPALHSLGKLLAAHGDLKKAVEYFRRAVQANPQNAEAHQSLGQALAELGEKDAAARHYQEAVRILKSRAGK